MTIDYSLLSDSNSEVDTAFPKDSNKKSPMDHGVKRFINIYISVIIVIFLTTLFYLAFFNENYDHSSPLAEWAKLITGTFIIAFGINLLLFITFFSVFSGRIRNPAPLANKTRLVNFAKANGLNFQIDVRNLDLQGMVFKRSMENTVTELLIFPDGTQIGNVKLIPRSTNSRYRFTVEQNWCFAQIQLPRPLPHMILDAKSNNLIGDRSVFAQEFPEQEIMLEGEFNKFFTLYVPKDYELDALYIFTPDVMLTLMETGRAYDMEIVNDTILIFREGIIRLDSKESLSSVVNMVDKIKNEVDHQAQRYSDDRSGKDSDTIASKGRRLVSNESLGLDSSEVFH